MTKDQYATLIYYWAGHPQPERIPEVLEALETAEWARHPRRALPIAGVVRAFERAYPDRAPAWRAAHPILWRWVELALGMSSDCAEWTDYHLAQWFITRTNESLDKVLDRVADGGEVGLSATIKLQELASQSVPFRKALEKARELRKLAMVIQ
jgi:hypothetical protein